MSVNPDDILNFLEKNAPRPLTAAEILDGLHLASRKARTHTSRLLEELAGEGTLVRLKGDRYSLPRQVNLVTGTVAVHRDGYGFVRTGQEGKDVFVPARYLREVMDGDRVVVRVERGWRGAGPEGRVIRVLERAHQTLVGRYEAGRALRLCRSRRSTSDARSVHSGRGAERRPPWSDRSGPHRRLAGKNAQSRGNGHRGPRRPGRSRSRNPDHRPQTWPPLYFSRRSAGGRARRFPMPCCREEHAGREDLRHLPLVTIDGETAKDFDDAVAVRQESGGRTRLWVAIADVGHYVAAGSVIDTEALERGTSVYFPGRAIPMLPERLSNGICSLNPHVERLAMVAEMLFDATGGRLESRFYPAVMCSQARLTYTQVRDALTGSGEPVAPALRPQLVIMAELAQQLTVMRRQRGSLDFDLPEAEIVLDLSGRTENIVRSERNMAHRLIEEFMLAANEAVATFLTEKKVPILYRVHEPPDLEKLQALQEFVSHFNLGLNLDGPTIDPRQLQKLLAEAEGKPEERVINQVLLRSMKQARYAPENKGHFGLAAPLYCHFTSPIRRYPDLLVHRALRQALRRGGMSQRCRAQLTASPAGARRAHLAARTAGHGGGARNGRPEEVSVHGR